MPTDIHNPCRTLAPRTLDRYLSEGWRPTGQSLYRCHYLRTDEEELHGCVQLRLPLEGFGFGKHQRKLLRRNARRFTSSIQRATYPDSEKLDLHDRYLASRRDESRPSMGYHVETAQGERFLDTHEVRVYDRESEELVAFSFFDLGQDSMYSKVGIFDPRLKSFSLGYYTMLLEIEYALDRGVRLYYPGYFSPSYPKFDYKLRLGEMEFYDIGSQPARWRALDPAVAIDERVTNPYQLCLDKLLTLRDRLPALRVMEYANFTARYREKTPGRQFLDGAVVGVLNTLDEGTTVIVYNVDRGRYQQLRCYDSGLYDMRARPYGHQGRRRLNYVFQYGEPAFEEADVDRFAEALLDLVV